MTVMKRNAYQSQILRSWSGIVMAMVLTISSALSAGVEGVRADESSPPAGIASYPSGKVTSIYERAFQIDGRTVSLVPEAVLVDRHGDPLPPTALRVDIDVKYHIQKGTTDKIDWMLLILPE
jgi:hypothetical protein